LRGPGWIRTGSGAFDLDSVMSMTSSASSLIVNA